MKISKQTIGQLAAAGITVKNYPGTLEAYTAKVWNDAYNWSINYHKGAFCGWDANGNEIHPTPEKLDTDARIWADSYTPRKIANWYDAEYLYVEYSDGETRRVIQQKINGKSKEVTAEYVCKLVAKDKKAYSGTFGKFADAMNNVLEKAGYSGRFWVYPTTYGIGVWIFWNLHASENIASVEAVLKSNNVEYYNEYSDKMYVYRFKISKKQANIKLALTA